MNDAVDNPYREGDAAPQPMIVTTGIEVAGHRIVKYLGVARGLTVSSSASGQSLRGVLKAIGSGSITEFNIKALKDQREQARLDAFADMVVQARALGADAVIGMRYEAHELVAQTASEVLAYGTAVRIETIV